jgi:hypothetical protein
MNPYTPQDYTGTGAAVTIASILGIKRCRWFQVVGVTIANASIPARVGDSGVALDVSSPVTRGKGFPIPSSGGQFAPPLSDPMASGAYNLENWYIVVATGDIVGIGAVV